MKVIYIGPHEAVNVPIPTGGTIPAVKGQAVNVPDSLGPGLLAQPGNWTRPADPPAKAKKMKEED